MDNVEKVIGIRMDFFDNIDIAMIKLNTSISDSFFKRGMLESKFAFYIFNHAYRFFLSDMTLH